MNNIPESFFDQKRELLLALKEKYFLQMEDMGIELVEAESKWPLAVAMLACNLPFGAVLKILNDDVMEKQCRPFSMAQERFASPKPLYSSYIKGYLSKIDTKVLTLGYSLLFFGYNSSGKTHTASYILARAIESGCSGYYISAKDLYALYNRYQFSLDDESSICQDILDSDFLVIDELGKEIGDINKISSSFEQILKYRIDRSMPTIIVSNLDIAPGGEYSHDKNEILLRYGNSVWEAFQEHYFVFQLSKAGEFRKKNRLDFRDLME